MASKRWWVSVLVAGVLLLAGRPALAGGGGGGPCAGFAAGTTLTMMDSCFSGVAHFVQAGAALTVRNAGHAPHTFTAVDGSFDTGVLQPGETAKVQLGKAGIVEVYCKLHGDPGGMGMAGVLVVGEAATAARASGTTTLTAAAAQPDDALLAEVRAQTQQLAELKTDVAAVRQAVEARPAAANPAASLALAGAPGALGIVLGGTALVLALRRKTSASTD
jgi:plastocyanin